MSGIPSILFGAGAGVILAGARTPARLIAGDLSLARDELEKYHREHGWKDSGLDPYLQAWRDHADPFATAVKAMQFYVMDSAFKRLQKLEQIRSTHQEDPDMGWKHGVIRLPEDLDFVNEAAQAATVGAGRGRGRGPFGDDRRRLRCRSAGSCVLDRVGSVAAARDHRARPPGGDSSQRPTASTPKIGTPQVENSTTTLAKSGFACITWLIQCTSEYSAPTLP